MILGLDLSTHTCGAALVGLDGELVRAETFRASRKESFEVRRGEILKWLFTLKRDADRPFRVVAIEAPYFGANPSTGIKLARVIGMAEAVALTQFRTPLEGVMVIGAAAWQSAILGIAGNAKRALRKERSIEEANKICARDLGRAVSSEDEADAIGLARYAKLMIT